MKYYDFEYTTLRYVYDNLLNLDVEVCGKVVNGKLIIQAYGTSSKRNMCQHLHYDTIIFHTHPIGVKPYPSPEDIVKVIKNRTIDQSIIFTTWGMWSITCKNKTQSNLQKIFDICSFYVDEIYHNTSQGTIYNSLEISSIIDRLCKKLSVHELKISIVPWDIFNKIQ